MLVRASSTLKMISFKIIIITDSYHDCLLHCTYREKLQESLLFGKAIFGTFDLNKNGSTAMATSAISSGTRKKTYSVRLIKRVKCYSCTYYY